MRRLYYNSTGTMNKSSIYIQTTYIYQVQSSFFVCCVLVSGAINIIHKDNLIHLSSESTTTTGTFLYKKI